MLGYVKRAVKKSVIRRLLRREEHSHAAAGRAPGALDPELWGCSQDAGELKLAGVKASSLVEAYGSPLHVVHTEQLLDVYDDFLSSFKTVYPNVVLATSYKTNPVPYVLKTLHDAGTHAEVISEFELWLALDLGVPPEKIILNGPGKTDEALRLAIENRISMINIDGPAEIERIAAIAREQGIRQRVGVRLVTSVGWSSQFGLHISSGDAEDAFRKCLQYDELVPCGLHLHLGTGIQDVGTYVQAVGEVLAFSRRLDEVLDIRIDEYDLGGGFGVPTVRSMDDWDTRMIALGYPARYPAPENAPKAKDYAMALKPLFDGLAADRADSDLPRIVFEPGRAITSNAQTLLLTVLRIKPGVDGRDLVIVDGGKNITMPLGWETHHIYAANRLTEDADTLTDVFGPLCHPGDVIVKNQRFPKLEPGDLLAVMDAGAYFVPNQMNFSNPRPAIAAVSGGEHRLVRRRESFEDITRLDDT